VEPNFCPSFEGPLYKKGGPSSQGGTTPLKKEEICHQPELRS